MIINQMAMFVLFIVERKTCRRRPRRVRDDCQYTTTREWQAGSSNRGYNINVTLKRGEEKRQGERTTYVTAAG